MELYAQYRFSNLLLVTNAIYILNNFSIDCKKYRIRKNT